eukprot:702409-Prymnesium_polylepis.1
MAPRAKPGPAADGATCRATSAAEAKAPSRLCHAFRPALLDVHHPPSARCCVRACASCDAQCWARDDRRASEAALAGGRRPLGTASAAANAARSGLAARDGLRASGHQDGQPAAG